MPKRNITQDQLKELFDYVDGCLIWKDNRNNVKCKGNIAGSIDNKGYRVIVINKVNYKAHRLIWLYHTGRWPNDQIDHINRDKDDNRIENLRECSTHENCQNRRKQSNNTSGHTGVSWMKSSNKWRVEIHINSKKIYLGLYDDLNEAIDIYKQAKLKTHTFQPTQ